MALYKRNSIWWISFTHNGQRIQRSTGTTNKIEAQEYHDKIKAKLWNISKLENKPIYSWRDAVVRWIRELDKVPVIRMRQVQKNRIRWLTVEEASLLLTELPPH